MSTPTVNAICNECWTVRTVNITPRGIVGMDPSTRMCARGCTTCGHRTMHAVSNAVPHTPEWVTDTAPTCPAWCTLTPDEHHADLTSGGSWFAHESVRTPAARTVEGESVTVHLSQLQLFGEQAHQVEAEEADNALIITGSIALTLTLPEARRFAAALHTAMLDF